MKEKHEGRKQINEQDTFFFSAVGTKLGQVYQFHLQVQCTYYFEFAGSKVQSLKVTFVTKLVLKIRKICMPCSTQGVKYAL